MAPFTIIAAGLYGVVTDTSKLGHLIASHGRDAVELIAFALTTAVFTSVVLATNPVTLMVWFSGGFLLTALLPLQASKPSERGEGHSRK